MASALSSGQRWCKYMRAPPFVPRSNNGETKIPAGGLSVYCTSDVLLPLGVWPPGASLSVAGFDCDKRGHLVFPNRKRNSQPGGSTYLKSGIPLQRGSEGVVLGQFRRPPEFVTFYFKYWRG